MSKRLFWPVAAVVVLMVGAADSEAQTPSTSIDAEYLMTVHLALDPSLVVDNELSIANIGSEGSWVDGPRIKANVVAPSGDWPRQTQDGLLRLDVRLSLQTDEGDVIFMAYAGIVHLSNEFVELLGQGEGADSEATYWMTAPTFTTNAEEYSWLNGVQAIGKMISFQPNDHVRYDVFAVN